jgi:hypothetical protein
MKFVPFLLKNIFRNKRRTLLTMTSIAVSLFLVATLLTVLSELENPPMAPDSALVGCAPQGITGQISPSRTDKRSRRWTGLMLPWEQRGSRDYEDPANIFPQMAIQADQIWRS